MNLATKKCVPCEGKEKALTLTEARKYISDTPGWTLSTEGKMIHREYSAKNFMEAIKFINRVAEIAESEDHHPDIHLTSYRKLRIELSTHAVKGLTENDFILAAKINELPIEIKKN